MAFVGFLITRYDAVGIQLGCPKYLLEGRKGGRGGQKEGEKKKGRKK